MPQQSASDRAYSTVRRMIVALELPPRSAVGEQQVAEQLGMSRTPVREAFARLGNEGLIEFRSRAGTSVSPIRLDAVHSAHFVREKLELALIEEATKKSSRQFRFKVSQAIDEQRFAIEDHDAQLFFASDERMHRSFAEMAGHGSVWTVIEEAKQHMDRVRRLSLQNTDLGVLLNDHEELLKCIDAGDPAGARRIMRTHLSRVIGELEHLVKEYPDYFLTEVGVS